MHKCIFIGIDIQIRRGCCFAVINETGTLINSGWLSSPVTDAVELVQQLSGPRKVLAVGIDAPRMPLVTPREWYWNRNKRRYDKRSSQKGYGRQCEIVISAHGIANPQWTPLVSEAPEWMQRGSNYTKPSKILRRYMRFFHLHPIIYYRGILIYA